MHLMRVWAVDGVGRECQKRRLCRENVRRKEVQHEQMEIFLSLLWRGSMLKLMMRCWCVDIMGGELIAEKNKINKKERIKQRGKKKHTLVKRVHCPDHPLQQEKNEK